jgi:hypothetical protein
VPTGLDDSPDASRGVRPRVEPAGHSTNVKLNAGATRVGDGDFGLAAAVRSQLAF